MCMICIYTLTHTKRVAPQRKRRGNERSTKPQPPVKDHPTNSPPTQDATGGDTAKGMEIANVGAD